MSNEQRQTNNIEADISLSVSSLMVEPVSSWTRPCAIILASRKCNFRQGLYAKGGLICIDIRCALESLFEEERQ